MIWKSLTVAGLMLCLAGAFSGVAWADEGGRDLTQAQIAELAAYYDERVAELEERIDVLDYQISFFSAAESSGMTVSASPLAKGLTMFFMVCGKAQLEQSLSEAKLYRDIYTAGIQDPAIVYQFLTVMELRDNLQDALDEYRAWDKREWDRVFSGDQSWSNPFERERLIGRVRYLRAEFDAQNDRLGSMVTTYRLRLGAGHEGPGGVGVFCFPAGVLVLMADGSFVPIETLRPGDMVLTMDLEAGVAGPGLVAEALTGTESFVFRIDSGFGPGLMTNGAHRFYTDRGLKAARDIEPGDRLLGRDEPVEVAGVERVHPQELASGDDDLPLVPVYNITVEGTHTFYVSPDGEATYLVHDSCGCAGGEE